MAMPVADVCSSEEPAAITAGTAVVAATTARLASPAACNTRHVAGSSMG
jgi:hypothetical protein